MLKKKGGRGLKGPASAMESETLSLRARSARRDKGARLSLGGTPSCGRGDRHEKQAAGKRGGRKTPWMGAISNSWQTRIESKSERYIKTQRLKIKTKEGAGVERRNTSHEPIEEREYPGLQAEKGKIHIPDQFFKRRYVKRKLRLLSSGKMNDTKKDNDRKKKKTLARRRRSGVNGFACVPETEIMKGSGSR